MVGKVFKALADGTRRQILEMLRERDLSAGEVADRFNLTKPSISHHLGVLKEAGLCTERREGQHIIYTLNEASVLEAWDGFLAKLCGHRAERRARQVQSREESRLGRVEPAAVGEEGAAAPAASPAAAAPEGAGKAEASGARRRRKS